MYVDIDHLKSTGLSQDKLKAIFETTWDDRDKTATGKKVNALIDLHANRLDDGIRRALKDARIYHAIDRAYEASQNQISFTLVRDLIDRNVGGKELESVAKDWGLESMLVDITATEAGLLPGKSRNDAQNAGSPGKRLSLPTFFNVFLPLVQAYVKIRWAKLFNDRDVYPLFKYEPNRLSTKDMALCRVVTARMQRMSSDMGYREDVRQSISGMLLYAECLNFPLESYYMEQQVIKGSKKVVKEGVRWYRPHPARTFYDRAHPLHTINSDTGCEFAGYWSMQRWGEVEDNPHYWNKDAVGIKSPAWRGDQLFAYYQQLYPCVAKFPAFKTTNDSDREYEAFKYRNAAGNDAKANRDYGVDVSVMYHKLIPKDWGLGDYEHPVWMRFVYAGDRTVIFAEPMGYCPVNAFLYEHGENRSFNSSLALELLPFQDHLGNLLSQYILTVKKNLIRIVAVDQDLVDKDFQKKIQNGAENMLRGLELFMFSGKDLRRMQGDVRNAFTPLTLQPQNSTELIGAINTVLGILERVLGFSAQEVGSQATHQQSATETSIVAANTTTRMAFTASGIDPALHAFKKSLYNAFVAYGSDQVAVQVAELSEGGKEALKAAGFELEEGEDSSFGITGSKAGLSVEEFSSERDGSNRINEPQAAQLMLTLVDRLMVPQIVQVVGIEKILEMFNDIASMFGVPADFKAKIKAIPQPDPQAEAAAQEQFVNNVKAVVQGELAPLVQSITQQLGEPLAKTTQDVQAIGQAVNAMNQQVVADNQAIGNLGRTIDQLVKAFIPPPGAPLDGGIPVPADSRLDGNPPPIVG